MKIPCRNCICLALCKAKVNEYHFIILDLTRSCTLFSAFVTKTYGDYYIDDYRKKLFEVIEFFKEKEDIIEK